MRTSERQATQFLIIVLRAPHLDPRIGIAHSKKATLCATRVSPPQIPLSGQEDKHVKNTMTIVCASTPTKPCLYDMPKNRFVKIEEAQVEVSTRPISVDWSVNTVST